MTLYLIRALKTGLVKIGISDSFDARISKLRREGADELEILKLFHREQDYIEGLEKEIHAELADYNHHGEWFDCSAEIVTALIASLEREFEGSLSPVPSSVPSASPN